MAGIENSSDPIRKVVEEGWKTEAPGEDPNVILAEARLSVFNEVRNYPGFSPEERKLLESALDEVQHSVLKKLPPHRADLQSINDHGGAENYVKYLMLQKALLMADSPETMRDILSNGMMLFWHVSGQEVFTEQDLFQQAKARWSTWEWLN